VVNFLRHALFGHGSVVERKKILFGVVIVDAVCDFIVKDVSGLFELKAIDERIDLFGLSLQTLNNQHLYLLFIKFLKNIAVLYLGTIDGKHSAFTNQEAHITALAGQKLIANQGVVNQE
jgi:hypothetical protein